jgi:hypothetical protein
MPKEIIKLSFPFSNGNAPIGWELSHITAIKIYKLKKRSLSAKHTCLIFMLIVSFCGLLNLIETHFVLWLYRLQVCGKWVRPFKVVLGFSRVWVGFRKISFNKLIKNYVDKSHILGYNFSLWQGTSVNELSQDVNESIFEWPHWYFPIFVILPIPPTGSTHVNSCFLLADANAASATTRSTRTTTTRCRRHKTCLLRHVPDK